ncbi:MAG: DUF3127 domain-containing protein [Tateyamaria sp.]|nr:DUF3127 domain-containing protein [Tateyamaria sp.]MDG1677761.1 DUF3127 domain-containing protein [Tateyamaria sp.]
MNSVLSEKAVIVEIKGKIIELLSKKSGQSTNGEWHKQEYILETESQYPKKICFMVWGEKIDQFNIKEGEAVEVSIDLESREYNGRWYTDVKAWKVSRQGTNADSAYSNTSQHHYTQQEIISPTLDDDEIPF